MRLAIALIGCLAAVPAMAAAAPEVTIVIADTSAKYQEAAQAASRELSARARVTITPADQFERAPRKALALVVTLGTRALQAALARDSVAPIVAALIPRSAYRAAVRMLPGGPGARPMTAVYLDQPVARQLNLVRLVAPHLTQIGVLYSEASEETALQFESAARDRRLVVVRELVVNSRDLSGALARVLGKSELLLALPDPAIFNAGTIHNVLLTALRAQQPLFGFSEAYVRAGALAAVYSSPEQAGRQAGEIAAAVLGGAPLPPPQNPAAYSVSINATVARALQIAVEPEEEIAARLRRMERAP